MSARTRPLRLVLPASLALALLATTRPAAGAPGVIRAVGVVRNVAQNLCLDVDSYAGAAGDREGLYLCDQHADQAWGFDSDGHVVDGAHGLCLAPDTTAAAGGTYTKLAACTGELSQLWTVVPRGGGFELHDRKSGLCLDVAGVDGASGRRVGLYACDNHDDQLWSFDTTSAEATGTIAKVAAADQEAWFRLLATADPTANLGAATLVTALAQTIVVPPVFAPTASMSLGGGRDLVAGLSTTVSPAIFAGVGPTLYTIGADSHLRQWTLTGDLSAAPATPLVGDLGCWDRDLDGVNDPDEDKNHDGRFDSADCGASPAGVSPSYPACWSATGDVAGAVRGSVRDGHANEHDCEYACWDLNHDHTFDRTTEGPLLTDAAYQAWLLAEQDYEAQIASYSLGACTGTNRVDCPVAPWLAGPGGRPTGGATGGTTLPSMTNPCSSLPTWMGPDNAGPTSQTCIPQKHPNGTWTSQCSCIPATFGPAPRPESACKAGRGSVAAIDLGVLPAPSPKPAGWAAYRKVFGEAGAIYAVDNLGKLWSLHGAARPVGTAGAVTGFAPPAAIGSGWGGFPSVFGGVGGVIYAVDATRTLRLWRYDPVTGTWPKTSVVIASNLPSTTASGGTDGAIYVQNGSQLVVYMDPRRDGTALAAPVSWGGDAPVTAVAGGIAVSVGGGALRATRLAADPVAQIPPPPVQDSQLCIPRTSICIKALAGGSITGSGHHYTASGSLSLVTDVGSWDVGSASLAIDLSPTRPYVTGTATVGLPSLGILRGAYSTKTGATATLSLGFGGALAATIGAGNDAIATDPDKFYLYADVSGDLTVTVLGSDIKLSSLAPVGSLNHGKFLFEPTTPILYADGLVAYGLLGILSNGSLGWWQDPVLGFSLGPCIPYTLAQRLPAATITTAGGVSIVHDGSTRAINVCGNVMLGGSATIDVKDVSIGLAGTVDLDLDLDNDGKLVWASSDERDDWALAADLDVSLSVFDLPAGAAHASLYYQGVESAQTDPTDCAACTGPVGGTRAGAAGGLARGRLRMAFTAGGDDPFAGTPLAALSISSSQSTGLADFLVGQIGQRAPQGSTPEWVKTTWSTFSILGWSGASLQTTMSRIGASFTGTLNPLFGLASITINGTGNWDGVTPAVCGSYTAAGPACASSDFALTIAGYTLAQSHVKTDFRTWMFDGGLDLGALHASMAGTANPSQGTFSVTGSVHAGGTWTGKVGALSGSVSISGDVALQVDQSGGRFMMNATEAISGCWPDANHCLDENRSLGSLSIDSSGSVTFANPFDTSKQITIALSPS
ncbi:MAG TPA: ricin-type beta-trefoil lectin domain protein [Kofleriaceae bacterium]|nr:ricin-type beta-trefoil lectin domain protein [Kofleriaceae bacterium]